MSQPEIPKSSIHVLAPSKQTGTWRMERDWPILAVLFVVFLPLLILHIGGRWERLLQFGVVGLGVLLLLSMRFARVYYTYLVIKPHSRWLRLLPNGVIWKYNSKPLLRRQPPFPVAAHHVTLSNDSTLGLLHDKHGDIDGIVVKATGWDFAGTGIETQASLLDALAKIAIELTSTVKGYSIGIGLVHARRQLNLFDLTTTMAGLLDKDVKQYWEELVTGTVPADAQLSKDQRRDKRIAENMMSLVPTLHAEGNDVMMAFVISVYREGLLAKLFRSKPGKSELTVRDVYGLNVVRLAQNAVTKLAALGVENPEFLDREDTQDFIRSIWDDRLIQEYHKGAHGSLDYLRADADTAKTYKIPKQFPHEHIALRRDPGNNQLQAIYDGTYHAVLMITRTEELQSPYSFRSLYALGLPSYTVTLAGTTVKSTKDVALLEFASNISNSVREVWRGIDTPSRASQRRDKARQQLADRLDESQYQLMHNLFVHVMAPSGEELEDDVQVALDHLEGQNLGPIRINEESVLPRAVVTAASGFSLT